MDYKWTALTVTTVGMLMQGITGRVVIVGLPVIASQLHADADQVVWITQAYILSSTVSLLLIGRIADLFGRVKLYSVGFLIFTAGSILSAVSSSPLELIAFRAIQGAGTGVLLTNASAIVTDASPREELGTMLGINQMALRLGNVAGLTVSGIILSLVDWRGLFYVNVPVGILGTIWAHRRLREIATKDPVREMDWAGLLLFSVGLTLVLLAVTFLSYGITDVLVGSLSLIVGAALLVLFVRFESRTRFPLLDPLLFRIRLFAAGNTAQILNSLAWGGILLLLAFYLQIGQGYSPLRAGLALLPLDGTYLVSSVVSGRLSDRHGTRVLATLGLVLNTAAFFATATFDLFTPYLEIAIVLVVIGVGNGMFTPPNLRAIMGSVPANRVGIASGFRNTMFSIGITASYGLVILFVTFGIPYNTFSALLQGTVPLAGASAARLEFLRGFSIATVILAALDAVAIIPSAMRGNRPVGGEATRKVGPGEIRPGGQGTA